MKATITEIVGKNIKFIEDGVKEIQEAELAEYVMDFVKLGEAEMNITNGQVTFCTMKVDAPKDSKPEGAKPGTKKKWEDDMVTFEILLTKAHDLKKPFSIKTEMLQLEVEKKFALFKATVEIFEKISEPCSDEECDNEVVEYIKIAQFEGHGDATTENVKGEHIKPHFIRMAETRAIVRALRWYTNNGCAEEEK